MIAPWRTVHRIADRHVRRFVDPFILSVGAARAKVTVEAVERSMAIGTPTRLLTDLFDDMTIAKAAEPAELAQQVYQEIISGTVTSMVDYVEATLGQPAALIAGQFDVTNPYVLRAAQRLTADLIQGVSAESKAAVRQIIFESVRDGVAPADAAKLIRQTVGLTSRQAAQVSRYRTGLLTGGRSVTVADRLSGRLSDRLLRQRAVTIARTETMRASNVGQQAMWSAMRDAGVVGNDFGQRWMTTTDDRLCGRCAPMNGQTVQLGYLFRETEVGVLPSARKPSLVRTWRRHRYIPDAGAYLWLTWATCGARQRARSRSRNRPPVGVPASGRGMTPKRGRHPGAWR
jgi:hypothetical protein